MRVAIVLGLALQILAGTIHLAWGGDPPDLKGTWKGDFSIVRSAIPPKAGPNPLAFTKPGFRCAKNVTYVIETQKGPLFSGTESFATSTQKFVGVVQYDGKTLYIADKYGVLLGTIVAPDKIQLIYLENTEHGQVAARGTVTRRKE